MPRVCVLLPARDAAATVGGAVRTIVRQTLRDLRLVVVDDVSTDRTAEIRARLAGRTERVGRIDCVP